MELYFDIDLCTGCKSCEVACARVYGEKRISVDLFDGKFPITAMCRHCETAPCLTVCPKDAITRDEKTGAVHVNENMCVGCSSCVIACPFGDLQFQERRHVSTKCNLCLSRLNDGEKPVCVLTCPTGALKYGKLSEMERVAKRGRRRREMVGAKTYAWRPK